RKRRGCRFARAKHDFITAEVAAKFFEKHVTPISPDTTAEASTDQAASGGECGEYVKGLQ
ncbi:hypothetical protein, partial [Rhodobacter sp. SGA-6-6]|uniref:hypothetical protein n=1 Tax=Rhodobacter sp. SGA-6-6 TaxID=2710882 RepID=UPI00197F5B64